ncbi:MAG: multiheme c-type cytochrome [Myxococcales bacterium]
MRALLAGLALLLPAAALAADFVGVQTCKACHAKAYEIWAAGPHAHAAASLTPAQREQPSCTQCHAPELTLRAGGPRGREPTQEQLEGITCESCHGAGQHYSPSYVMRDAELARAVGLADPGERSCKGCHLEGSPGLSPFDFATKVKVIDHWTAERKARARAAEPDRGRGGTTGIGGAQPKGRAPHGPPDQKTAAAK